MSVHCLWWEERPFFADRTYSQLLKYSHEKFSNDERKPTHKEQYIGFEIGHIIAKLSKCNLYVMDHTSGQVTLSTVEIDQGVVFSLKVSNLYMYYTYCW